VIVAGACHGLLGRVWILSHSQLIFGPRALTMQASILELCREGRREPATKTNLPPLLFLFQIVLGFKLVQSHGILYFISGNTNR
jgi:hypothetical protein